MLYGHLNAMHSVLSVIVIVTNLRLKLYSRQVSPDRLLTPPPIDQFPVQLSPGRLAPPDASLYELSPQGAAPLALLQTDKYSLTINC